MLVFVIISVVIIIAMAVVDLRLRRRVEELTEAATRTAGDLDRAQAEVHEAGTATAAALVERDDALERVSRARRDAADVANRLREETAAKVGLERRLQDAEDEVVVARAAGPRVLASVLWELAIRESEQRWRVSVAVDPDAPSPIEGAGDRFRAAVEIEVDAAREESGASIDLTWKGETIPEPERAVAALALVRDVITAHGTSAATTAITIDCAEDAIGIVVEAVGSGGDPLAVAIPESFEVEPGRARIS